MLLFVPSAKENWRFKVLVSIFVVITVLSKPGFAADSAKKESDTATSATVTISRSACDAIVAYQPDASVEYQPGVDVNGKPVTPAEGPNAASPHIKVPDVITFPVTLDFFEFAGISQPTGISGKGTLGEITYKNGQVYFNDQPIGNAAHNADLIAACKAAGYK
ncbi:hypothetical protein [Thalassospira sp. TSL5-1]|uniref:hypothetical protein n=1 Tax=Thalassospira sp. TSL5-1 TaxID=1544451 RepID=UPI000939AAAE|nr:hypothetical protein [Thalassospira sp. TSL5-1]